MPGLRHGFWVRFSRLTALPRRNFLFALVLLASLNHAHAVELASPGAVLRVIVDAADGQPGYRIERFGKTVVARSRLGLVFSDAPSLDEGLKLASSAQRTVDETWAQPWGEKQWVRNHYNELRTDWTRDGKTVMTVVFRVYDDGVGFRYEVPAAKTAQRQIADELTEFALRPEHEAWWTGAYLPNRYEYLYRHTPLTAIWKADTPLTMKTKDGLYLSIHEAALIDYAAMTLEHVGDGRLKADLIAWSDGAKVKTTGAFVTPWRTIAIADRAAGLVASDLILNLNEPNKLGDVSWVEPGKYVGIWWELHIGKSTWGAGPRHGATTANTKRYIDFAAKYGFSGVLVEGWNLGWDGDWIGNGDVFNFTTPYPDYDFDALAAYAREKGVRLIGHHETSGGIANYERQLEAAMATMAAHGVNAVKTGYVRQNGHILRLAEDGSQRAEWQHGQFMVRHYQKALEVAAKYRIAINTHEPIKDTGLRRTYPNWLTREGARGQEYNAWSEGNPPEHETILPFTRLLAGPMDFTPGIFDLQFAGKASPFRVHTTLAKQLALYVVIYSPLQMAADLPENYEANLKPFQFIRDVPADWSETRVLDGEIGDFIVIARRDRASRDWYLGAVSDENGRLLPTSLGFLEGGVAYRAEIYRDGDDAHWRDNPSAIAIETKRVTSRDVIALRLAAGGGIAIRFTPEDGAE
ncbi:MAG: glycoside hydrolase family 97 protein [Pseudomonadota bacterium]